LTIDSQELKSQRKKALTRRLIVVVHDPRLRADREGAREDVVALDGRLEVHQPLT
jgi:hypothetical protein